MCGRARCSLRSDEFSRACHLNAARPLRHINMDRYRPSYNVAPGFNVPVVRRDDDSGGGEVLHCMKWGLIPSFTNKTEKPDHFRMFNARSESLQEKPSFRRLIPKNRCLVSVEGFYEWKKDGSKKQPYYIHFKDARPLVFAALFDYWRNSEGEILYTFTIITTSSSSSLGWLHDRMPVILGNKELTDKWLSDSSLSSLDKIFKPYEEPDLVWYPVTPAIGKLSFEGPECIQEIRVKAEETKSISQFFSKKKTHEKEPKLESSITKEGSSKSRQLESVKEEPESQSDLLNTKMKDEVIDTTQLESMEEAKSKDDHHKSISKKDNSSVRSDIISESPKGTHHITVKRDFEEFSSDPKSTKETCKQLTSSAKKKSKGASDKQPTLFSYFGKS